jgi:hypothetical protein
LFSLVHAIMLCARNYLCLMWMDVTWAGKDSVPRLGYVEWPLAGPDPFCKVWWWVVNKGSLLDFLMHLIIGVPYNWTPSPSSQFSFEFYGSPLITGLLGSFLTYARYLCPYHPGKFHGGMGHFIYPGAEVYFGDCLNEWLEQLVVGRLDCVALGGAAQWLFQLFGVHFHGAWQYFNIHIPLASGSLRTRMRFCSGGHCLVFLVIGSSAWMRQDHYHFGFHWLSGVVEHLEMGGGLSWGYPQSW